MSAQESKHYQQQQQPQQLVLRATKGLGPDYFLLKLLVSALFLAAAWFLRDCCQRRDAAERLRKSIPEALLRAFRSGDAVLLLGPSFSTPLGMCPMSCRELAAVVLMKSKNSLAKITAALKKMEATNDEGYPEESLGLASEVAGWNFLQTMAASHWAELAPNSKADKQTLRRRLAAAACLPFTATLSTTWRKEYDQFFRCRVGRNFGGYSALLSKPRVDLTSAAARPALLLWPALYGGSFFASTSSSSTIPAEDGASPMTRTKREAHAEAPWHSCEEVDRILDEEGPYCIFLRDVFKSKVILMLGWPEVVPEGHLAEALSTAWAEVRARCQASGTIPQPIGYSLTTEMIPNAVEILENYGIAPLLVTGRGVISASSADELFLTLIKSRLDVEPEV
eukprot:CAMPEP_0206530662 /NCGR_PEP_ID=MMETSP0325_2-20121206/3305_1 /ASSEMBLY_ACC=CAM_ASM_000347 /TAXON_ID=2866 /ORGANISM="Crypthecodinium cohnii, Strain Seligo" /LENGTH=394 /DNA_ID=CAMNT_0054026761 /DNA_START=530 /DNA_END=1714 /DNA_ORIENTATION=+